MFNFIHANITSETRDSIEKWKETFSTELFGDDFSVMKPHPFLLGFQKRGKSTIFQMKVLTKESISFEETNLTTYDFTGLSAKL